MKMKYEFSFTEMNYGSISIESDTKPTRSDVVDAIMSGNAYIGNTDYKDIKLCGETPTKSKPVHDLSR